MANDHHDVFDNQKNDLPVLFQNDLLSDYNKHQWPRQIEFVASEINDGGYLIGLQNRSKMRRIDTGEQLDEAAGDHYLTGIQALVGSSIFKNNLSNDLDIGQLLIEFSNLRDGLRAAGSGVPPGEVLSRLITRELQRQTGEQAHLARHIQPDISSAHELVAQIAETPELATHLQSTLPDTSSRESLTDQLGHIDITTELWNHQLEALASWIDDGMTGYVNMATATGKTVLGLAAVAHSLSATNKTNPTSLGSLHPKDQDRLRDACSDGIQKPSANRPSDVLIVTTDNLLGVQWARLFQEHCQTPPEYTKIVNRTITLPNLEVHIRSAASLTDIDPSDYRIAIFDEVHNYSDNANWGKPLETFINANCPVLALTGSVTEQLETMAADTEADFTESYTYTHEEALKDGVIPDFEWSLTFTGIQTDTDVAERFMKTTRLTQKRAKCKPNGYEIITSKLEDNDPSLTTKQRNKIAGKYDTPTQVASALRDATDRDSETETINGDTAPTNKLETLAHGLDTRTLDRMNLRADLERVVELAESAVERNRPALILTRSYKEAKTLWQDLYDRNGTREVMRFERDQEASKHADIIAEFDGIETDKKILIAPGKYIGQGKDIQSVEVGINLSRQGSGMNTALVQRLGRLLRNAGEKNTVEFYHVIGTPPASAILPDDGKSFVKTVSEFFGQVIEPDTQGILKPPEVLIDQDIESDLIELESIGAPTLKTDQDVMSDIESAYVEKIISTKLPENPPMAEPIVTTDWFNDFTAKNEQNTTKAGDADSEATTTVKSVSETDDGTANREHYSSQVHAQLYPQQELHNKEDNTESTGTRREVGKSRPPRKQQKNRDQEKQGISDKKTPHRPVGESRFKMNQDTSEEQKNDQDKDIDKEHRLIEDIQRVADSINGTPSLTDIDAKGEHSLSAYSTYFGSWKNALKAADLTSAEDSQQGSTDQSMKSESPTSRTDNNSLSQSPNENSSESASQTDCGGDHSASDGVDSDPQGIPSLLPPEVDDDAVIDVWENISDGTRHYQQFILKLEEAENTKSAASDVMLTFVDHKNNTIPLEVWKNHGSGLNWEIGEWFAVSNVNGQAWEDSSGKMKKSLKSSNTIELTKLEIDIDPLNFEYI